MPNAASARFSTPLAALMTAAQATCAGKNSASLSRAHRHTPTLPSRGVSRQARWPPTACKIRRCHPAPVPRSAPRRPSRQPPVRRSDRRSCPARPGARARPASAAGRTCRCPSAAFPTIFRVSSGNCSRYSLGRFASGRGPAAARPLRRIRDERRSQVLRLVGEHLVRLDLRQRLDASAGLRLDLVDVFIEVVVAAATGGRDSAIAAEARHRIARLLERFHGLTPPSSARAVGLAFGSPDRRCLPLLALRGAPWLWSGGGAVSLSSR